MVGWRDREREGEKTGSYGDREAWIDGGREGGRGRGKEGWGMGGGIDGLMDGEMD